MNRTVVGLSRPSTRSKLPPGQYDAENSRRPVATTSAALHGVDGRDKPGHDES